MQISQTLNQLTQGDSPLLSKSEKRWIIQDSQYLIVIRLMLEKKVGKVVLRQI